MPPTFNLLNHEAMVCMVLYVTYTRVSVPPWGTHSCKFRESSGHVTQPLLIPSPELAVT